MSTEGTFTLLGTGASTGVPIIACHCPVCTSQNPRNTRLRCSAIVRSEAQTILIDPGPDLRQQALRHKINHLDGVIISHTHYDHIGGMDELRIYFYQGGKALPCLLSEESMKDIKTRYYYMFRPRIHGHSTTAQLDFHPLPSHRGAVEFCGQSIAYMTYDHSGMRVTGFRFGDLAYICDIHEYPETVYQDLKGVKTLVVSALRHDPSPVHFTVSQAVAFAERVGCGQAWLTHIGHELEHDSLNAELPPQIRVAYDGLELNWSS